MKYKYSYAVWGVTASDQTQYSPIARRLRCLYMKPGIALILSLAMLFLSSAESIGAERHSDKNNGAKHRIEMIAEETEDGLLAYRMVEHQVDGVDITSRYNAQATIPGPTIVLTEGDTVRLTATDLEVGARVAWRRRRPWAPTCMRNWCRASRSDRAHSIPCGAPNVLASNPRSRARVLDSVYANDV